MKAFMSRSGAFGRKHEGELARYDSEKAAEESSAKPRPLDVAAVPVARKYGRATAMERAVEAKRAYERAAATRTLDDTTTAK